VNLTEVLIAPSADVSKLAAAREAIAALGVAVHHPNEAIGVEAARLRQRRPISLPDAYCLATAKHTNSTIASFDQKILKAAKREGVKAV
jgi:predicted nucleic acid-binding protein